MKRTTNGFAGLSLPAFSQQVELIVKNMTANPHFTTLQTEVQALATANTAYTDLVAKAASRDKVAITVRDVARANLVGLLHNLGADVTWVAKGNTEILLSSGFPFTQPPKTSPNMVKPMPPQVAQGVNNGQIDCKTYRQPGIKSVNYYITADVAALTAEDNSGWEIVSYNKTRFTFSGLLSGQRYYIKVGLVGVRGQKLSATPLPISLNKQILFT